MKSKTNWTKLRNISDKEIERAAKTDADTPILGLKELRQFKPATHVETIDVRNIRNSLHR